MEAIIEAVELKAATIVNHYVSEAENLLLSFQSMDVPPNTSISDFHPSYLDDGNNIVLTCPVCK